MKRLKYQIASWPDEPSVVAELLLGDQQIGHVVNREGKLILALYRDDQVEALVNLDAFQALLSEISRRLS